MAFHTNAAIQGGEYGVIEYVGKNKKAVFKPLGKVVVVENITKNIETNAVTLRLSWDYVGEPGCFELPRKALSDSSLLQDLIDAGADVTKRNFHAFVDTIRLQELEIEATGVGLRKVYDHLGWKTMPTVNAAGFPVKALCYRASSMIGPVQADYVGSLKVKPMGTFEAWKSMVEREIIGHTPAEVVMLASLTAIVNGLISAVTTGENPIIHLNGLSGTGKSAIAMAGASVYGEPFDGERKVYDASGNPRSQTSVYGSWSATENATLGRLAGNRGCLVVLNELGKMKSNDLTTVVYNLSEGTDKARMNKNFEVTQLEGYSTTILSVGEHSILDRCQNKADGLRVRVLELDATMTTSAESADRIKAISRKNNGWAAPMMAEYIISNGGVKMVVDIFEDWRRKLLAIWPDTPFRDRYVAKFPTLFLTTATLAKAALGIAFHEQAVIDFFLERETHSGADRNFALSSYEVIKTSCMNNTQKFYVRYDKSLGRKKTTYDHDAVPLNETWGRITYMSKALDDARVVVAEIELLTVVAERLLRENGFANKKTCIAAWKQADLLQVDDPTHAVLQRKINPSAPTGTKENVYVLRVLCAPEDVEEHMSELKKQQEKRTQMQSKIIAMREKFLAENDEGEEVMSDAPEDAEAAGGC